MLKLILLLIFFSPMANADTINLTAKTSDVTCKINQKCDIHGLHSIEIINNTDERHYYYYMYQVCINGATPINCLPSEDGEIYVEAHNKWNNHHDLIGNIVFTTTGKCSLTATTSLFANMRDIKEDVKNIDVTD